MASYPFSTMGKICDLNPPTEDLIKKPLNYLELGIIKDKNLLRHYLKNVILIFSSFESQETNHTRIWHLTCL